VNKLGLNVKIARIKKGLKQYELAQKIGVSRYYLSALENGKVNRPSIEIMKAISEELTTPITTLFFNDDEKEDKNCG
jgi:putative transcriptional regulator